ncbi:MAG: glycosyltransferase family 2 protein [Anaerolineaceae bacterium]
MPDSPLITIITPSYQQAAFLEQTIRSVLEQDYPNIEYMVIDGGSDDGSVEIIKRYADRLTWWVSEKDNGQAEAINKGFARARGKYIAWVNSDDFYTPGAIREAVEELEAHPDIGLVFGEVQVVDKEGKILNHLHYGDWGLQELMTFHIIGQPAVFMRRSVLEKAGPLDIHFHFLLDHHLWLRMGLEAGIRYVPKLWAGAHYHEGCKNLAQAAEFGKDAYRIVDWMQRTPAFSGAMAFLAPYVKAGAERINGFYLLDAREYKKSFRCYWRGFLLAPGVILPEWYRMIFALLAPLGFENMRERRIQKRIDRLNYR